MNPFTLSLPETIVPYKQLRPYTNELARININFLNYFVAFILVSDIFSWILTIFNYGISSSESKMYWQLILESDIYCVVIVYIVYILNVKFNFNFVGLFPLISFICMVIQIEFAILCIDVMRNMQTLY